MADGDEILNIRLNELQSLIDGDEGEMEASARLITEKLLLLVEGCLVKKDSPDFMAHAFINNRLSGVTSGQTFGSYNTPDIDEEQILNRSFSNLLSKQKA